MKKLGVLILLSIVINIFLYQKKNSIIQKNLKAETLIRCKDISYQDGYRYFKSIFEKNSRDSRSKKQIVFIWDSLNFNFKFKDSMLQLDSLASILGPYSYKYFFITEMETESSKSFLKRMGISLNNFIVLGDMDYFISSIYNRNELSSAKITLKDDKVKSNFKIKPLSILIHESGEFISYSNKLIIINDGKFINSLKQNVATKEVVK